MNVNELSGRESLKQLLVELSSPELSDEAEELADLLADRIEDEAQEAFLAALKKVLDEEGPV